MLISSNGFSLMQHFCNSIQEEQTCKMETSSSCCNKKMDVKKDACCSSKAIFTKLKIEGFTAKQIFLKSTIESLFHHFSDFLNSNLISQYAHQLITGLSPPNKLDFALQKIKAKLLATNSKLQVFRC